MRDEWTFCAIAAARTIQVVIKTISVQACVFVR